MTKDLGWMREVLLTLDAQGACPLLQVGFLTHKDKGSHVESNEGDV